MLLFFLTTLCILLLIICYQDFKYFSIPLFLVVFLFINTIVYTAYSGGIKLAGLQLLYNSMAIIVIMGLLTLYYKMRTKKIKAIYKESLGVGDMLFWFGMTPLFSFMNFIIWFISSLTIVLLLILLALLTRYKNITFKSRVPLAGMQAAVSLIFLIINKLYWHINLMTDIVSLNNDTAS